MCRGVSLILDENRDIDLKIKMASRHYCICTFILSQRVFWRTEGLEKWPKEELDLRGETVVVAAIWWWQADFHTFDGEYLSRFSAYRFWKFGYYAANCSSLHLFQNSFLLRRPGKSLLTTAFLSMLFWWGQGNAKYYIFSLGTAHQCHWDHRSQKQKEYRIWKNIIWIFQGFSWWVTQL